MPNKFDLSPCQKKHFPEHSKDSLKITDRRAKRPSGYLLNKDASPAAEKKSSILEHRGDSQGMAPYRPSKRMAPNMHQLTML